VGYPSAVTAQQGEAIVLRTWPIHEADQIVSLFTRAQGRIKGVAKSAAKSRRRFGGALEPMTWVTASYVEKPKQELVRLDACEVITSPLSDPVDYARAAALAFYAEVLEETLPDHDPHDAVFRLLLAGLDYSIHHYVVYVAARPPRSIFKTIAARAGRTIIYIPIGQLSPVALKKIRVVHVLDGYDKRDIAKEYLW